MARNPMRREWRPIMPEPERPRGPRVHWFSYVLLAAFFALLGAVAGRFYALVFAWWTGP